MICGGGAQGAAIAYTLAKRGLGSDTVLIDKVSQETVQCCQKCDVIFQGEFGKGTTMHSSGLIPLLKPSPVETKLSKLSKNLYLELEREKGFYTGWRECGSLYLGQTDDRMHHFRRYTDVTLSLRHNFQVTDFSG